MRYEGIYECMLYRPWWEEVTVGECLYYGNRSRVCFHAQVDGDCPYGGQPRVDVAKAKLVVPADELIDMLRSGR